MPDFYLPPDENHNPVTHHQRRLIGQKPPLKPKEVWAIRIRLQIQEKTRDLALFNLAIDSKLRSCDLVTLRISDVITGGSMKDRAVIVQRGLHERDYLFPSRVHACPHLSTRQYARIVKQWVACIGLDPHKYGTHSLRRTKASLIYKKTGNLRAVQLLLGHAKLDSTVPWSRGR